MSPHVASKTADPLDSGCVRMQVQWLCNDGHFARAASLESVQFQPELERG